MDYEKRLKALENKAGVKGKYPLIIMADETDGVSCKLQFEGNTLIFSSWEEAEAYIHANGFEESLVIRIFDNTPKDEE